VEPDWVARVIETLRLSIFQNTKMGRTDTNLGDVALFQNYVSRLVPTIDIGTSSPTSEISAGADLGKIVKRWAGNGSKHVPTRYRAIAF